MTIETPTFPSQRSLDSNRLASRGGDFKVPLPPNKKKTPQNKSKLNVNDSVFEERKGFSIVPQI